MKQKRYTEEQIVGFLQAAEAGRPLHELCREHGFSQQSFYRWKAKFGGLELSDVKKLRALEVENSRLKKLVADLALDNAMLKEIASKKW